MATSKKDLVARFRKSVDHPGVELRDFFMKVRGINVSELARATGLSRKTVSNLVNGHKAITPRIALLLAMVFEQDPESWMAKQARYDLWVEANRDDSWQAVRPIKKK